jgi:hypothetical protein
MLTILPPLILAFFGYKTVRNLQTIKATTTFVNNNTTTSVSNNNITGRRQQIDNQLARMVVVQTVVYFFEAMPFAASFAYTYITINWTKTEMQQALENLFTALGNVISSLFVATTFYIYYLQSAPFRHSVKSLFGVKSGRVQNARGGQAGVQPAVVVVVVVGNGR